MPMPTSAIFRGLKQQFPDKSSDLPWVSTNQAMENLRMIQGRQGGPPWRRGELVPEMSLFLTFRHRQVAESNRNRPRRRSVARQGGAAARPGRSTSARRPGCFEASQFLFDDLGQVGMPFSLNSATARLNMLMQ